MFGLYEFFSQQGYLITYNWKRLYGAALLTLSCVVVLTFWRMELMYVVLFFVVISTVIYKLLLRGNEIIFSNFRK